MITPKASGSASVFIQMSLGNWVSAYTNAVGVHLWELCSNFDIPKHVFTVERRQAHSEARVHNYGKSELAANPPHIRVSPKYNDVLGMPRRYVSAHCGLLQEVSLLPCKSSAHPLTDV